MSVDGLGCSLLAPGEGEEDLILAARCRGARLHCRIVSLHRDNVSAHRYIVGLHRGAASQRCGIAGLHCGDGSFRGGVAIVRNPKHFESSGWVDGGAVAAPKIQRRLRHDGPWSHAGMAIESEIKLTNQERGKEWEYRVLAVNKAGDGEPSNTVMAVL